MLVLEVNGRLIDIHCNLQNDSLEDGNNNYGILNGLPDQLSAAYYWRQAGWDVVPRIPPNLNARMLPGRVSGGQWADLSKLMSEMNYDSARQKRIFDALNPIMPEVFSQENWQKKRHFRAFIDNRPHGKDGSHGDLLMVRTNSDERNIYHIKDGDFEHPRILLNSVEVVDLYSQHVFMWRKERFDFMPHGKTII